MICHTISSLLLFSLPHASFLDPPLVAEHPRVEAVFNQTQRMHG
jgi:hypothetical protein